MSSNASAMTAESTGGKEGSPSRRNKFTGQSYAQVASSATKRTKETPSATKFGEKIDSSDKLKSTKVIAKDNIASPSDKMMGGVHNPYKIKKSTRIKSTRLESPLQLTTLIAEHMEVFVTHGDQFRAQEWYGVWQAWLNDGITSKNLDITKFRGIVVSLCVHDLPIANLSFW